MKIVHICISVQPFFNVNRPSLLRQCQRRKAEDAIFFLNHTHLHITISIHKNALKRRLIHAQAP